MGRSRDDRLIDTLVGRLAPVRRLRPLRARLALWSGVVVATVVTPALLAPRPYLPDALLLEVVTTTVGALFLAGIAFHAIHPDVRPRRADVLAACSLVALIVAAAAAQPTAGTDRGLRCLVTTLALGLVPLIVAAIAVRRAATTAPATVGALLGSAALLAAYAGMRLHCPVDDGLHLVVGHALPIVAGGATGAAMGQWLLARWTARR
jgi:hypothetical protein